MKDNLIAIAIIIGILLFVGFVITKIGVCMWHAFTPMYEAPLICRS